MHSCNCCLGASRLFPRRSSKWRKLKELVAYCCRLAKVMKMHSRTTYCLHLGCNSETRFGRGIELIFVSVLIVVYTFLLFNKRVYIYKYIHILGHASQTISNATVGRINQNIYSVFDPSICFEMKLTRSYQRFRTYDGRPFFKTSIFLPTTQRLSSPFLLQKKRLTNKDCEYNI